MGTILTCGPNQPLKPIMVYRPELSLSSCGLWRQTLRRTEGEVPHRCNESEARDHKWEGSGPSGGGGQLPVCSPVHGSPTHLPGSLSTINLA